MSFDGRLQVFAAATQNAYVCIIHVRFFSEAV